MYEDFYGLNGKPFNLTPDPRFLYLSEKHKEAFAHLVYGIKNRAGFVMISGEVGTGKTTICRSLLNQLDDDTDLAFIFNPILSPGELLRKINEEFGIATKANTTKGLIDELNAFLLKQAGTGRNCVLVIDEAQDLDAKLLEQVRLLSNLETETQKLLQIILIGQPELAEKLELPELRQLNQRITARYHLKGLSRTETMQYIAYRLRVAGGRRRVRFTKGAVRAVYRISKGTPRVINSLCDRALLIGYTLESHTITPAIIRKAQREIRGQRVRAKNRTGSRRGIPWPVAALLVVIVAMMTGVVLAATSPGMLGRFQSHGDEFLGRFTSGGSPNLAEAHADEPLDPAGEVAMDLTPPETTSTRPQNAATSSMPPPPELTPELEKIEETEPTVVEPEPEPEPKSPPVADAMWWASLDPADSARAALASVAEKWDVQLPDDLARTATLREARSACEGLGLSTVAYRPKLDELLLVNYPALIEVMDGDRRLVVGLTASEDDRLFLAGRDNGAWIDRSDLVDRYAGRALIPWRDPRPDTPPVFPWSVGDHVRGLQNTLEDLGLFDGNPSGECDRETISLIGRIQRAAGLPVDGIAGQQTRMVVASWADADGPAIFDGAFSEKNRARVMSMSDESPQLRALLDGSANTGATPSVETADKAQEPPEQLNSPVETASAADQPAVSDDDAVPEQKEIPPARDEPEPPSATEASDSLPDWRTLQRVIREPAPEVPLDGPEVFVYDAERGTFVPATGESSARGLSAAGGDDLNGSGEF